MKPPTTDEIRRRVLNIVASKAGKDPNTLNMYLLLRRSSGGRKGLGFDDQSIEELTPVLQAWLDPYNQRIRTTEVNNADKVKTISDLADLVEGKIKAACAKRQGEVEKLTTLKFAELAGVDPVGVEPSTPLNLPPAKLEELRVYLNTVLADYGLQLPITVEEMRQFPSLRELFKQIETELNDSNVFHP